MSCKNDLTIDGIKTSSKYALRSGHLLREAVEMDENDKGSENIAAERVLEDEASLLDDDLEEEEATHDDDLVEEKATHDDDLVAEKAVHNDDLEEKEAVHKNAVDINKGNSSNQKKYPQ